jgi:hypothetical protein
MAKAVGTWETHKSDVYVYWELIFKQNKKSWVKWREANWLMELGWIIKWENAKSYYTVSLCESILFFGQQPEHLPF